VTSITAGVGLTGGTITTSGTIAADTFGMLVSKSFLTNQGYTTNTGTVTGTGTTGTIPVWSSSSSALGDSPLTVSIRQRHGVSGTGVFPALDYIKINTIAIIIAGRQHQRRAVIY
jgi:hypothetical protein